MELVTELGFGFLDRGTVVECVAFQVVSAIFAYGAEAGVRGEMRETGIGTQGVGLSIELELEDEEMVWEGGKGGGDRADVGKEDGGVGAVRIGV